MLYQMNQNENTQNQFSNAIRELQIGKLLRRSNITKSCGIFLYIKVRAWIFSSIPDPYLYWCSWLFFGLFCNILVFTETIPAVPRHIMCGKNFCHVRVVYIECNRLFYAADFSNIPIRNTKTTSVIVDKSIKRYLTFWTQVIREFDRFFECRGIFHTRTYEEFMVIIAFAGLIIAILNLKNK